MLLVLTLTGVKAMWAFYSVITLLGVCSRPVQPAMQSFLPFLLRSTSFPRLSLGTHRPIERL